MSGINIDEIISKAASRAEAWQARANELLTAEEKAIQEQMKSLLTNPVDKTVLTKMIDQSFRSHIPSRVADQVNYLLREYGVPDFFNRTEKLLIQMFLGLGRHFPTLAVPKMVSRMRQSSSRAIISGEVDPLRKHLRKRHGQGVRMNINHLGEALLGEQEALHRLETYIQDLKNPDVEYISVKISTIYSQISSLAFDHTVNVLQERLGQLYRVAKEHHYKRHDGTVVPKLVNLDMEEYRDLEITYKAFTHILEQEEFKDYAGGIVLQAYLPDSFEIQKELTEWARRRVDQGGAPIMLRIVKGANLEMEMVESSLNNWPLAAYDNKLDVDANYKRMVLFGMEPKNIKAVNLGIASHNLFELAFAYETAKALDVIPYFYFEMLEGMADHVRRALCETSDDVLLYAPVASEREFINAIAYLIRRLDENTSPENFLRYSAHLNVGSEEWRYLYEQFVSSCRRIDLAPAKPNRIQNRNTEIFPEKMGSYYTNAFTNEPDTDWSLAANRVWAEGIRDHWKKSPDDAPLEIPIVVGGEERFDGRDLREYYDPSQHHERVLSFRCALGNEADAREALAIAEADPSGWRKKSYDERHEIFARAAHELRKARGDLIGSAAAATGKVYTETDVEVSEAIDFAEFYPYSVREFDRIETVTPEGKGVGLVISPWNFPVAIPCGGVTAALAAGNTVIFKPSSDAIPPAWILCQCFWRAGVPKAALQFLPCPGGKVGGVLTNHPDVDFVILTGGTETGLNIIQQKPGIYLAAETGGKNATIVTDMADRDQAVKNVIYSAFGNCGQKCSATSLLILESSIYEDEHFKQQLVDAADSFKVGSAWAFENRMAALIKPPSGDLERGLTTLEEGEEWALKPAIVDNNPYMWSPGIKYGVRPGSYTHMTEFFGPVLGVMKAENLDEAIKLVNQTGFGLTSGIESLDTREQEHWKEKIRAGNLYINRGTTGAITLRQPFGGMGKSALGPGIKAGSPDYVSQFMNYEETGLPEFGVIEKDSELLRLAQRWEVLTLWNQMGDNHEDIKKTARAVRSFLYWAERKFMREEDYFHLRGQDNILRYLPIGKVVIRLNDQDTLFETLARIAAARIAGCTALVSKPLELANNVTKFLEGIEGLHLLGDVKFVSQDDQAIVNMIPKIDRIRYAAPDRAPESVLAAAAETGFFVSRAPVYMEGRLELLQYFRQQSICNNYHRYGNLGERATV